MTLRNLAQVQRRMLSLAVASLLLLPIAGKAQAPVDAHTPEAASPDDAFDDQLAEVEVLRTELREQRTLHGRDAEQLIPVLKKLANAELNIGEREYAAARLERVVELIRTHEGHYTQSLMLPLLRLAKIYMDTGRYERAIAKLRYAQHLTHRRDGVYSLDQVELIAELARAFLGQNEGDEAQREMRLAFDLSRRVHGEDNIRHVPGMMRFAAWFRLIGEDRRARRLYQRAIMMLETEHGPEHHSLIEPLTHLSAVASMPGYYKTEREAALRRADKILSSQAGVDSEDRAASAVRLGDFYTRLKRPDEATLHYQRAWQILSAETDPRLDQTRIFARPVVLNFPYMILPDSRRGLMIEEREIKVTYEMDIDATGKVSNVDLVEHSGPTSLNRTLLKTAFRLRFRPGMQDGEPVAMENFRITETLRVDSPLSRSMFMEQLREEFLRLQNMLRVSGRIR